MNIVKDLESLGCTADEVAKRLLELGITGARFNKICCPVANYLTRLHPDYHFRVVPTRVEVDGLRVPTTDAVMDFVARFDKGQFPDLVG